MRGASSLERELDNSMSEGGQFMSATRPIGMRRKTGRGERGFTLLEYCAGAAVILLTVWVAMNAMGGSIAGVLDSITAWANQRASEIDAGAGTGQGGGSGGE